MVLSNKIKEKIGLELKKSGLDKDKRVKLLILNEIL